jgi:prepilin-type N-terminal cleavage/methylation domain-containing protein
MQIIKTKFRRQQGFSLLEVLAALTVVSIAGFAAVQKLGSEAVAKTTDNAAVSAINVQNAARSYRAEHGTWPTSTAQLVSANLLTSAQATSPFNTAYTFSVSGNQLVISNIATNANYAKRVSGLLPSGAVSGSTYSFRFLPPGTEASVQSVYSLDGSKSLTGSMNAGGNNITNVGSLSANTVNTATMTATGRVTAGEFYTAGAVNAGSLTASGQIRGGSLVISGAASTGNLSVNGNVSATGNMTAGGNITAAGRVTGSHLQSTGTMDVDGNANIDGTLNVGGVIRGESGILSKSITDPTNPQYVLAPAGNSNISKLTVKDDFNITKKNTIGNSCLTGGVSFDSSDNLLVCKSGLWALASSAGKAEYLSEEESSYTFGDLIIKSGKRRVGEGRKSFALSNPFPSGNYRLYCSTTYDSSSASNSAAACGATQNLIIMDNGSSSTKTMHWMIVGFKY